MKIYEDKYLRNRVNTIRQQQQLGKLLVDNYKTGMGLPTKDELGAAFTRSSFPHAYMVGEYGWLDHDPECGLYTFILKPGAALPPILQDYKILQLAEVVVNAVNKTAHIKLGETLLTFTAVPVWKPGYNLLNEINEELVRQNTGIVVWKITWENEDQVHGLFAGPTPILRNGHASVTLTGYAFDPDNQTLVYFGCVGYKTSIESIRATLITGKPLSLNHPGENDGMVLPGDHYDHIWQAMPEYTSHHACFVTRTALPGKWESEDEFGYLLVFHGSTHPKEDLQHLFIERLIETLEVPVLEEWAEALWDAAKQFHFLSQIETSGDCIAGARLVLKADWKGLIEKLLQESGIQLT